MAIGCLRQSTDMTAATGASHVAGAYREWAGNAPHSRALIVHADDTWFNHVRDGGAEFFEKIAHAASDRAIEPWLVHSESVESFLLLNEDHTHIMIGPKRHNGPRIFHAHPSYLRGYWYLDPKGYFWNSSIVDKQFDPQKIDPIIANDYVDALAKFTIRNNKSKRPQAPRSSLGAAQAAIFVQDIEKYRIKVHYINTKRMIAVTAKSVSGPVYVKLHPLFSKDQRQTLIDHCQKFSNVVITDASIHDVIAASDVIISQNSAVGFEALLHRKPVLTCAQSDYLHASLVCLNEDDLRENIRRAKNHFAGFPFSAYLYWFLAQNMLEPRKDDFAARAMHILFG